MVKRHIYLPFTIFSHYRMHLDELVALFFLLYYGEHKYPGIKDATFSSYDGDTNRPINEAEWMEKGHIALGFGGGRFDEHGKHNDECAATLVLRDLGLRDDPRLKRLADEVLYEDNHGGSDFRDPDGHICLLHWRNSVNEMHRRGDPLEEVYTWIEKAVLAHIEAQENFLRAKKQVEQNRLNLKLRNKHSGIELRLCAISSDIEEAGAAARHKDGFDADLVIKRDPSNGCTLIAANRRAGIPEEDFAWLIGRIRTEEVSVQPRASNGEPVSSQEGMNTGWYYFRRGMMAFAGTPTHPNAPKSEQSLEGLAEIGRNFLERGCLPEPKPWHRSRKQSARS